MTAAKEADEREVRDKTSQNYNQHNRRKHGQRSGGREQGATTEGDNGELEITNQRNNDDDTADNADRVLWSDKTIMMKMKRPTTIITTNDPPRNTKKIQPNQRNSNDDTADREDKRDDRKRRRTNTDSPTMEVGGGVNVERSCGKKSYTIGSGNEERRKKNTQPNRHSLYDETARRKTNTQPDRHSFYDDTARRKKNTQQNRHSLYDDTARRKTNIQSDRHSGEDEAFERSSKQSTVANGGRSTDRMECSKKNGRYIAHSHQQGKEITLRAYPPNLRRSAQTNNFQC